MNEAPALRVAKWKKGRSWAVYDSAGALVVVALYKRGAQEVARRLAETVEPHASPKAASHPVTSMRT